MNTAFLSAYSQNDIVNSDHIAQAARLLQFGELVAFPTETVYGLGSDVFQPEAIKKIYTAKGRPSDNPLIVHIAEPHDIQKVAREIPPYFEELSQAFWPGPLTILAKKRAEIPDEVTAGLDTVAVRCPRHEIAQALIAATGSPLVAPSANRSGKPSPTQAAHVLHDLDGKIAAILDGGDCSIGLESTVISTLGEEIVILRPGEVTQTDIEQVIGQKVITVFSPDNTHATPLSPGMKYRHYAPEATIHLVFSPEEFFRLRHTLEQPLRCFVGLGEKTTQSMFNLPEILEISPRNLYAEFRQADHDHIAHIIIFCSSATTTNMSFFNRLQKSSSK